MTIKTKLFFTKPEEVREAIKALGSMCSEASDTIGTVISNTQVRALLVDELREKSKGWDHRFRMVE